MIFGFNFIQSKQIETPKLGLYRKIIFEMINREMTQFGVILSNYTLTCYSLFISLAGRQGVGQNELYTKN